MAQDIDIKERIAELLVAEREAQRMASVRERFESLCPGLQKSIASYFLAEFTLTVTHVRRLAQKPMAQVQSSTAEGRLIGIPNGRAALFLPDSEIDAFINLSFGGATSAKVTKSRKRTQLEDTLIEDFAGLLVSDIVGCTGLVAVCFEADDEVLSRNWSGYAAQVQIDADGVIIEVELFAADEVWPDLRRDDNPGDAAAGAEDGWTQRWKQAVSQASLPLTAMIAAPEMRLGDVTKLKPNDVIELASPDRLVVSVCCEGVEVLSGGLGKKEGRFAVHVRENAGLQSDGVRALLEKQERAPVRDDHAGDGAAVAHSANLASEVVDQ